MQAGTNTGPDTISRPGTYFRAWTYVQVRKHSPGLESNSGPGHMSRPGIVVQAWNIFPGLDLFPVPEILVQSWKYFRSPILFPGPEKVSRPGNISGLGKLSRPGTIFEAWTISLGLGIFPGLDQTNPGLDICPGLEVVQAWKHFPGLDTIPGLEICPGPELCPGLYVRAWT